MSEETKKYTIDDLSPHLFWDVDRRQLDVWRHQNFIVERVMTHGVLSDWKGVKNIYGLAKIKEIILTLRNLDDFSIAFLSVIFGLKKEDFRCYTEKQSQPNFWNY